MWEYVFFYPLFLRTSDRVKFQSQTTKPLQTTLRIEPSHRESLDCSCFFFCHDEHLLMRKTNLGDHVHQRW